MNSEIIIYQPSDGKTKIQTRLENEMVWLTIEQMAELLQKGKSTINEHILNIYKEGELDQEASMRKIGNSDFSTKPTDVWMNQQQLAELFDTSKQNTGQHINKILDYRDLNRTSVVKNFFTTAVFLRIESQAKQLKNKYI